MQKRTFAAVVIGLFLLATGAMAQSADTRSFDASNLHYTEVTWGAGDGGFILRGATEAEPRVVPDVRLIRTDRLGHLEWDLTIDLPGDGFEVSEVTSEARDDLGYMRTGTFVTQGGDRYDIFLARPDVPGQPVCINGLCNETGPEAPDVELRLEPTGPVAVARGDILNYRVTITPGGGELHDVGDVWITVALPDQIEIPGGNLHVTGASADRIDPAGAIEFSGALPVPPAADAGIYRLIARLGTMPDRIVAQDVFAFEVID